MLGNPILAEHWDSIAGFAGTVWTVAKYIQSVSCVDKCWCMGTDPFALIEQDLVEKATPMLDSTTVKVLQHTSRAKKGISSSERLLKRMADNWRSFGTILAWFCY